MTMLVAPSDSNHTSSSSTGGGGYVFPILRGSEILSCLEELGISMQPAELQEPMRHKEKLRQVFLALLETCCGKTEEDLDAPLALEYAKERWGVAAGSREDGGGGGGIGGLHTSNYSDVVFFQSLALLCDKCGCDFTLRDLLQPTPNRLREQLSAIINLAKFREEQLTIYAQLNEPRSMVYKDIDQAMKDHDELRHEEAGVDALVQQVQGEMDHLDHECQQLELDIAQSNKVQMAIRHEADLLKKQAADLKDELDTTSWALHESSVELDHWKSQVVRSPERKQTAVEQKTLLLQAAKAELAALEQNRAQTKKAKHAQHDVAQELQGLQFQVMLDLASGSQQVSSQMREDQANVVQVEHQTSLEESEVVNAERALHRQEDTYASETKRRELQLIGTQEMHDTVTSQLLRLEKERRDAMARTEQGEREVRALELLMEEEQEKSEQEIQHMIAQYQQVEREFLERHYSRMAAMGITADE